MVLIDNCTRSRGNLNRNSYCSWSHSNPTHSNQWMERKRRRWSVGGDERQLEMVFLYCVDLVSFFVYGIVVDVFLWFWLFRWLLNQIDWRWIATHRLSNCKSPHHYHCGICFLPWIMVVFSGLTIFNGAYPVRYECHESTVWVELLQVLLEPWIAKRGKNRSCRCMLQWLWMGMCLNEWVADHMEREQGVLMEWRD